jgi:uncharacterized membrane protein
MSSLFPVLSETGRRGWVLAALVLGGLGLAVAAMRRDWVAAAIIVVTTAALVLAWWWGRGAGGDEE